MIIESIFIYIELSSPKEDTALAYALGPDTDDSHIVFQVPRPQREIHVET